MSWNPRFFVLVAVAFISSSSSLYDCSDKLNSVPASGAHSFTNRGLNDMLQLLPAFVHLATFRRAGNEPRILEIGCGSGHNLLELQSKLRTAYLTCLNKKGYGYEQSDGSEKLLKVAKRYNISILCHDHDKTVWLPEIQLAPGLQEQPYPAHLNNKFDFIVSIHALNQGKLDPPDSKLVIPRVYKLLRVGGIAFLNLLYRSAQRVFTHSYVDREFTTLKCITVTDLYDTSVTISAYLRRNHFGIMIKKCKPRDEMVAGWGCILSDYSQTEIDKIVQNDSALARTNYLSELEKLTRTAFRISKNYDLDYIVYLFNYMSDLEHRRQLLGLDM